MGKRKRNFACGQLTKSNRRDSEPISSTDDASGLLRRDSESTSRPENASGEENEALRRDLESASSVDNVSRVEYDVFLSFRGSDTRQNFTDHLYRGMIRAGIRTFLDSEELELGENINEVLNALNKSQIYIPIFSQNFASSEWCLREVKRMVECHSKSNGKKEIIPIFYNVETDAVKLKTYLYKNAILKLKKKKNLASREVQQWENALQTVGKIIGLEIQDKREGEQIESIVEVISCKLKTRDMIVTEHLVEDNAQVEAIMKLLDVGSDGVRFIGIHGMGGVGKTTLATVLYNKLSFHFGGCSFLRDVRVNWQLPGGPLDLQKKLLSSFLSSSITNQIKDVNDGIKMIKRVYSNKKTIIVLDDLDKKEQLEKLAGKSDWFGSGSRIIITTRDEMILTSQVESSSKEDQNQPKGICHYAVHEMAFNQALQLFCKHAFRSDSPIKDYDALSKDIVLKVGMLPLAIEVIGSHLYGLGFALDSHGDHRKLWKETLKKLDGGPFKDVKDALKISYEGLDEVEKQVFLDIACFFTNEDQTYPVIMWDDCDYYPETAIRILCQRSLIKIRDNKFGMHDQIRDLGRYIIHEEYPCKFSRVWTHKDAEELLERKERNVNVEALSLTSSSCSRNFADEELASLPNLRFLRVKGSDFSGDFKNLFSQLRWLSWQTWQTTFQAKNFHFSRLVVLNLSDSNIKDGWDGWKQMKMNKLKVLDLTGCKNLRRTPDFSNFMSLEKLILAWCIELTKIHSSIGKLKHLTTLNIQGCRLLREFPAEFGFLQSLTEIIMPQTFKFYKLPETFGNLKSLLELILDKHPSISELPESIGGLVKLTRLSLRRCKGIKLLPCSIGEMKMLIELDLSNSGIEILPDSIGYLRKLKVIKVSYTGIKKFPCTIGQVEMLEKLHAKKCWNLTDENLEEIRKLSHLRILDLSYTHVCRFPTMLDCLSCLQTLELGSSHLQEVPDPPSSLTHLHLQAPHFPSTFDLSSLVSLDHLELHRLTSSIEEPDPTWMNNFLEEQLIHPLPSSLSTLKFRGISLLPPLSNLKNLSVLCVIEYPLSHFSVYQDLIHLRELKLSKCKLLVEISGLPLLKNLQRLDLNRLESLVEIDGLSELESLLYFRISHCNLIERLPNLSKLDKLQHIVLEACPKIRAIEGVKGLESLAFGYRGCTVLERFLDVSRLTWLSHKVPMYDVFLSYSGPNTRLYISDIISQSLLENKVRVYRDEENWRVGVEIGGEHLEVLNNCQIYIVIFSKDYASSSWCLRELTHIIECTSKSNGKKRILPIFYDVEIDDVKLHTCLYLDALYKHSERFGDKALKEWKMALREAADISWRFHLRGVSTLGELVEWVTEEVLSHLMNANEELDGSVVEDQ